MFQDFEALPGSSFWFYVDFYKVSIKQKDELKRKDDKNEIFRNGRGFARRRKKSK